MPPKFSILPHLQHSHISRRGGGALEEEEVVALVVDGEVVVSWSLE